MSKKIYNDEFQYTELKSGVRITNYVGAAEKVIVPAEIDGAPVTEINEDAFADCEEVLQISLPATVKRIGKFILSQNQIDAPEEKILPPPVYFLYSELGGEITIDKYTGTENSAIIPAALDGLPVTKIGDYAFQYCENLTAIEIPNSVKKIGLAAFEYCTALTAVDIPDSVTAIGYCAFSNCKSLRELHIPNSVTEIDRWAFGGCSSLKEVTIPDSITKIDRCVFGGCSFLKEVIIPDSVTKIDFRAFQECISLETIRIPAHTKIADDAFYECRPTLKIIRY